MGNLFTIGHTQHKIENFLGLLMKYDINYILDVRSTPYSKYAEQFNRENIKKSLSDKNIIYSFTGNYFGARQAELSLYSKEGFLDFEKVRNTANFKKGFENVMLGLQKSNNIALMCTEKDPFDCHRTIMVARAFDLAGVDVNHILSDGSVQNQEILNRRLLDKYFPDRNQITLFNYMQIAEQDNCLEEAYRKRNSEIGYHIDNNEKMII